MATNEVKATLFWLFGWGSWGTKLINVKFSTIKCMWAQTHDTILTFLKLMLDRWSRNSSRGFWVSGLVFWIRESLILGFTYKT